MKKVEFVEALCTILEKNHVLSHVDAVALKENFKHRSQEAFDDFLLEEGIVTRQDVLDALSQYYDIPYMDPIGYFFDHYLLIKFPKDFLLRNRVLPIEVIDDNILMVLANNPNDEDLLPELGNYVSYDIEFRVGIASEIIESIEEFYDKSITDCVRDDTEVPETEQEIEKEARKDIEGISTED